MTHPFHPCSGQRGACVGRRGNRADKLLLLRFDDGRICSVPPQWTDAADPNPKVQSVPRSSRTTSIASGPQRPDGPGDTQATR
ncbi:hypothetical protein JJB98_29800 [Bradyrhizobium diazoefficiens]|nr:hypothetical protein JJB98_29800 [Bradyrhizobium diazoefficiens]